MTKLAGEDGGSSRPAGLTRRIFGPWGATRPEEHADEDMPWHVMAGTVFNRAVAYESMSSYFDRTISKLSADPWSFPQEGQEQQLDLDYIVPGELPDTDRGRAAYLMVYTMIRDYYASIEEMRQAIERTSSK